MDLGRLQAYVMDVDEPGVQAALPEASTSSLRSAVDEEAAAANATLARLEELTAKPYDYTLHLANIKAASTPDDREDARNFMAQMLPLTEELWLDWIVEKRTKFEEADATSSLEAAVEVLELYKRACNDYLSMRIRRDYANFVVGLWYTMRGYDYPAILEEGTEQQLPNAGKVNEVGSGVFTEDFVREELEQAVSPVARRHLTEVRSIHPFSPGTSIRALPMTEPHAMAHPARFRTRPAPAGLDARRSDSHACHLPRATSRAAYCVR